MMARKTACIAAALAAVLATGCGRKHKDLPKIPPSAGSVELVVGYRKATVVPITMSDGTKCIVVLGESHGAGTSISCNWEK